MGLLETLVVVLVAALLIAVVLGFILRGLLGNQRNPNVDATSLELERLRETKADLERKLAVADLKCLRLDDVEAALKASQAAYESFRSDKALAETELAASRQECVGLRVVESDLRDRLSEADQSLTECEASRELLRRSKEVISETLAGRVASLQAAESSFSGLNRRLTDAAEQHQALQKRFDALRDEKSSIDEILSAKIEALRLNEEHSEELRIQAAFVNNKLIDASADVTRLTAANAALRQAAEQESKNAEEKLALLSGAREEMSLQFKSLAEDVMSRHGESFTKQNKEQMEDVLAPLRSKLGEFEQKVQASHVESVRERATLSEQIRNIVASSATMSRETKELTEALRGRSQSQGAWGEMVLSTVLERSGLRANEEYTVQQSFANEEGKRLRPDVIVHMPGNQKMVVDAKVSLTAFEAFVNANDDEDRSFQLQRHLASVRSHIATLGSKEYHSAAGSTLDYVVMFVPIEGALAAALQADPNLVLYAAERNVALTTPTTLMIALRTIANVWHVERRNQNAEDIANRAGKLYDKFVGFVSDMGVISDSLSKARFSYDKAMNKLSSGNGNLVRQAEQLKAMGGRASKSLPQAMVEAADNQVVVAMTTHTSETEVTTETTTEVFVTVPDSAIVEGHLALSAKEIE